MSNPTFTPDKGTLFYVSSRHFFREGGGLSDMLGGAATTERRLVKDRSYQDTVFRSVGVDDRTVVGTVVHGSTWLSKPIVFVRSEWDMFPVGPEVVEALGLSEPDGDAA